MPLYPIPLVGGIDRNGLNPLGHVVEQKNQLWRDGSFHPHIFNSGNRAHPSEGVLLAVTPTFIGDYPLYTALTCDSGGKKLKLEVFSLTSAPSAFTVDIASGVIDQLSKFSVSLPLHSYPTGGIYYTGDTSLLNYYFPDNLTGSRGLGPFACISDEASAKLTISSLPGLRDADLDEPLTSFTGLRNCRGFLVGWGWKQPNHIAWSGTGSKGVIPGWGKGTLPKAGGGTTTSLFYDPTSLAGENWLENSPGRIMDILPMKDSYIVYKDDSLVLMRPSNAKYVWSFNEVTNSHGIPNPNAACQVPGGQAFYSISGDVVLTDGSQFEVLKQAGGASLLSRASRLSHARLYYLYQSQQLLIQRYTPVDDFYDNVIYDFDSKDTYSIGDNWRYSFPIKMPSEQSQNNPALDPSMGYWLVDTGKNPTILRDLGSVSTKQLIAGSTAPDDPPKPPLTAQSLLTISDIYPTRRISGTDKITGNRNSIKSLHTIYININPQVPEDWFTTFFRPFVHLEGSLLGERFQRFYEWAADATPTPPAHLTDGASAAPRYNIPTDSEGYKALNADDYSTSTRRVTIQTNTGVGSLQFQGVTISTNIPYIETLEFRISLDADTDESIPGTETTVVVSPSNDMPTGDV